MHKKIKQATPLRKGIGSFRQVVFLLMVVFMVLSVTVQAQSGTVTGTVTSENNEPLAGASIIAKQSGKTVSADNKGKYTIAVAAGDTLMISYAGYGTQQQAVGSQSFLSVKLKEEAKMLEEVSIGYQRMRKSDLTGAISSVKAKEMNLSSPTLSQALVGKVAGVQVSQVSGAPYSGAKIRVRGIGSVNASSEPLYVVDGYPVGGNVSQGPGNSTSSTNGYNASTAGNDIFINPDDIESIEILKDAASAAIYGSRASAGVVLITTKRGKQGKGKMNYDYQVGVNQLSHKVKMLNSFEFSQLFADGRNGAYHDAIVAGKKYTWDDSFYSDDNATRIAKLGSNPGNVTLIKEFYDFASQKALQPKYNTDWQDALYQNALNQRHNISFTGGNNNVRYLISGGYQNQDGIIISTGQKRINLRANIDADVSPRLKISSSMFITRTDNKEVEEGRFDHGAVLGALVYMPFFPEYNPDGSLALGAASAPIDGYNYAFQGIENPVALATKVKINRKGVRGTYNASATYELIPGLFGKVNLGAQTYNEKYDYWYPTSLSSGAFPAGSTQAQQAATSSAQTIDILDQLSEFTLNYKKKLGKGNLDVLAGYSAQQTNSDIISVTAKGYTNDLVPEITGKGADASFFSLNPSGKTVTTLVSYLGRAIYSFDSKYFLTGSFRVDGSSRFGPDNRWGKFPSVSAGWALSNEKFYGDWLGAGSTVKLRASWGLTGNNNIGNYRYEQTIGSPTGVVIGNNVVNAVAPGGVADKKLGWESTSQFNFGLDLGLLNNRLNVIVNYYISKSYDLLVNQNIAAVTGSTTILTNLHDADVRNKGIDAQIDARVVATKDFNLNFSGNINFNRNEVKSLGGAPTIFAQGAERPYNTHVTMEGQPIGMFYGFKVGGMVRQSDMANIAADNAAFLSSSNTFPAGYKLKGPPRSASSATPLNPGDLWFVDTNGDGIVNEADKTVIGTPYPDFTYGFSLYMNYKALDLSASFNGSKGNEVLDGQDYYIKNMEGSGNNYAIVKNRYRSEAEPGNGSIYRASRGGTQSNSSRLSDFYLQNGSFFRCTNITLGYNLTSMGFTRKLGLSLFRVYASVDNAFTVTKYLGYNPEVDYNNGTNLTPGVDYGKYPLVRAFSFGIKTQF